MSRVTPRQSVPAQEVQSPVATVPASRQTTSPRQTAAPRQTTPRQTTPRSKKEIPPAPQYVQAQVMSVPKVIQPIISESTNIFIVTRSSEAREILQQNVNINGEHYSDNYKGRKDFQLERLYNTNGVLRNYELIPDAKIKEKEVYKDINIAWEKIGTSGNYFFRDDNHFYRINVNGKKIDPQGLIIEEAYNFKKSQKRYEKKE